MERSARIPETTTAQRCAIMETAMRRQRAAAAAMVKVAESMMEIARAAVVESRRQLAAIRGGGITQCLMKRPSVRRPAPSSESASFHRETLTANGEARVSMHHARCAS